MAFMAHPWEVRPGFELFFIFVESTNLTWYSSKNGSPYWIVAVLQYCSIAVSKVTSANGSAFERRHHSSLDLRPSTLSATATAKITKMTSSQHQTPKALLFVFAFAFLLEPHLWVATLLGDRAFADFSSLFSALSIGLSPSLPSSASLYSSQTPVLMTFEARLLNSSGRHPHLSKCSAKDGPSRANLSNVCLLSAHGKFSILSFNARHLIGSFACVSWPKGSPM